MEKERRLGLSAVPEVIRQEYRMGVIRGKLLLHELRCAWQRAWFGFDHSEVQFLGVNFVYRMSVLLRRFKENYDRRLRDPETGHLYTREETTEIIDEMIRLFDNCDELYVYRKLYGVDAWKDEDQLVAERMDKAEEECDRCREKALELFSMFCFQLWHL